MYFVAGDFVPGECGSVVVDSVSNKVYGHIVASDPLGHGYVVPIFRTIDQISTCLGMRVALADPRAVEGPVEMGPPVRQQEVTVDHQMALSAEGRNDSDDSTESFPCPFALKYPGAESIESTCNETFWGIDSVRYAKQG